jgi:hypothetical protein
MSSILESFRKHQDLSSLAAVSNLDYEVLMLTKLSGMRCVSSFP